MFCPRKLGLPLLGLAALLLPIISAAPAMAKDAPVRIGMVSSLFNDVPPLFSRIGSGMFAALMKEATGMEGEMVIGGDALTLAKSLQDGKLDLGVFHGVEFAWAQQRYPNLKPLMTAVTKYPHAQAHIVINKADTVSSFGELKGKEFVVPLCSRAHCVLFLNRNCSECGEDNPKSFFGKVVKQAEEDALDNVSQGNVSATVIDAVGLEKYGQLKPGCHARLKILKPSEHFPNGVIVYKEGALAEKVLSKFRTGLLNANKTDIGQEMMRGFKITSFELVPANYQQMLADIIKIYPSPSAAAPK